MSEVRVGVVESDCLVRSTVHARPAPALSLSLSLFIARSRPPPRVRTRGPHALAFEWHHLIALQFTL